MTDVAKVAVAVVLIAFALALVQVRRSVPAGAAGAGPAPALPSPEIEQAGFTFTPGTSDPDQQLFTATVAAARPEARRLIAMVDGAVDVAFRDPGPAAAGSTRFDGKRYLVSVDVTDVAQRLGQRGVSRVVLHELGHVVDFALVPKSLEEQLDREIPAGYPCPAGEPTGSCTASQERFAESFAKWATGDIGVDVYVGYRVPPPNGSLDTWGAPLAQLADTLSRP